MVLQWLQNQPELALALFVAPALLDAAFDTSPRLGSCSDEVAIADGRPG